MANPDELVRVTDLDTGHKLTIPRTALPHGNFRELKESPVDVSGFPTEPEHNAVKPTGASATTTEKEN